MTSVSVFIRARNEAEGLARTLPAIAAQRRQPDEVVVLDNESDDGTREVARRFGASVAMMARSEFSYGKALNRAIDDTSGDVIVFLSAHSPPVNPDWLSELVQPIETGTAAATFGRQVPEPGVNHLEEWVVRRTFPRRPARLARLLGLQRIAFSNANAAVLRTLVLERPFDEELAFAEDQHWARRASEAGIVIEYCPRAAIYHSHPMGPGDLEGRMQAVGRGMAQVGVGGIYRNLVTCTAVHAATMGVDALYCLGSGYWRTLLTIPGYRREYFRGLRRGLRDGAAAGRTAVDSETRAAEREVHA